MSAFGKPKWCSECDQRITPLLGSGRPRLTCGEACARERMNRERREEREYMRTPALVENAKDRAALADFNAFARRAP